MKVETLKKANRLSKKIYDLESAIDYLHNGHEVSLCYWFDSNYGNSYYKHIITLNEDEINEVKEKTKNKIEQLKKELEEL